MQQLEHDEDSDALVQRKRNECIEIGEDNKNQTCYKVYVKRLQMYYFRA